MPFARLARLMHPVPPAIVVAVALACAHSAPLPAATAPADTTRVPADTTADTLAFTLRESRRVTGGGGDAQGLVEPAGVAVDAFGGLYVADRGLHRLVRFDASGAWIGERGALGSEAASLRRPSGVALAGAFTVAVLDEDNRRLVGFDLYGERMRVLVDLNDAVVRDATGPVRPVGLAGDRGGALFVADGDQDRIVVFDVEGRLQRVLGGFGERPGSFRGLAAIAVARRGELVTAERAGGRIQRLDPSGRALASWRGAWGPARGRLVVAVDDSGRVAVADEIANRVWVYAANGRLLATRGDLEGASGVTFGRPGELWVAEARAGRVRRLDLIARPRVEADAR